MNKKNFDMDAAIRRALRESIEAHAHEWEPKFETGVGPVGDDAPFDNKVSEDCDKEEACCKKCKNGTCNCGEMDEGTIPGDAHEWEPGFETGVGPVGDDNPFTKAVNESFVEGGDWEKDSFGAPNHRKEGISFADGGDECQNGVVATSQKNSGEVVSSDNLSEGEDEEGEDEGFLRNVWQGAKAAVKPAVDRFRNAYKDGKAQDQAMKDAQAYAGNRGNYEKNAEGKWQLKQQNTTPSAPAAPAAQNAPSAPAAPAASEAPAAAPATQNTPSTPAAPATQQDSKGGSENNNAVDTSIPKPSYNADKQPANGGSQPAGQGNGALNLSQIRGVLNYFGLGWNRSVASKAQYLVQHPERMKVSESVDFDDDIIAEERDRFFNIINRIENLYD